ncbi:MAG: SH3 domain-containing protein [Chloroflexi bacterium]|nr:SH3 domain-containing protein [Chloroflexota bacterium]
MKKFVLWLIIACFGLLILQFSWVSAMGPGDGLAQQPTVDVPTVTGTPAGPVAIIYSDPEEQINVRSGPGTDYPRVGILLNRQEVPALGRTPAGDWVQIIYQGVEDGVAWVYAPLVRILGDELPIVEPPPTPTPLVTPTIDPTLASQFVVQVPATRMPTLTPPPPLVIPTFVPEPTATGTGGVPIGFVIIGLALFGVLGLILSFLRRR